MNNFSIPYPFQLDAVTQIDHFQGRALLASDMGLGKTLTTLWWIIENPSIRPAIVVCPAGLKDHWAREARHHVEMPSIILDTMKPSFREHYPHDNPLWIINYEILEPWMPFLRSLNPMLVIVEEAHYVKSRQAKRSKLTRKLCVDVPHLIAISGTPFTNRPAELFNVINLIDPKGFPSFIPFANRHCAPTWTYWGWQYKGAERLPELHKKLTRRVMVRQRKKDVLSQLPSLRRIVVPLTLDTKSKLEYERAEKHFLLWLREISPARARRAKQAQAIVKVGYLLRLAATLKYRQIVSWVTDYFEECDQKLALYGIQKELLENFHEHWNGSSVLINGDVPTKKRDSIKNRFNKNPQIRLFIGNNQAAGTGISLQCPTLAFCQLSWTPGEHAQIEARIHGIGRGIKGRTSEIYYLVAAGTIEEKLCGILQEKQYVLDQTLDGNENGGNMNVYDLLLESLEKQ